MLINTKNKIALAPGLTSEDLVKAPFTRMGDTTIKLIDDRLITAYSMLSLWTGEMPNVTSWYRNPEHEKSRGRDPKGPHTQGKAIDLQWDESRMFFATLLKGKVDKYINGLDKSNIIAHLRSVGITGFGLYIKDVTDPDGSTRKTAWVHIDTVDRPNGKHEDEWGKFGVWYE